MNKTLMNQDKDNHRKNNNLCFYMDDEYAAFKDVAKYAGNKEKLLGDESYYDSLIEKFGLESDDPTPDTSHNKTDK